MTPEPPEPDSSGPNHVQRCRPQPSRPTDCRSPGSRSSDPDSPGRPRRRRRHDARRTKPRHRSRRVPAGRVPVSKVRSAAFAIAIVLLAASRADPRLDRPDRHPQQQGRNVRDTGVGSTRAGLRGDRRSHTDGTDHSEERAWHPGRAHLPLARRHVGWWIGDVSSDGHGGHQAGSSGRRVLHGVSRLAASRAS